MLRRKNLLAALISVAGFGSALVTPANAAFTCPDTVAAKAAKSISSLNGLFSGANDITANNRLGEVMADLRGSGTSPALVVDYLVSAYCPLVAADSALSDQQKVHRVQRFARMVTGLAYVPPGSDEDAILVEMPLAPDLVRQVDEAARRAGVSRDEWIEKAINRVLAQP
ncbi:ribbon-helix-helix domain-containing protein [Microvirga sp. ACRRW]|uniref:ribbon-helix-helix domain-containing protein n=1 Tax=Microvirga sp. ACRRW TaxID=2918205 RepID=UPI001EF671BC|nr:CopG family transcriptional regulator [Microvirga sp. ACRRW]MCG7391607.1 ribbon-helix-helix domain-containing protein [Microvirga sp. ACRRW]